MAVHRWLREKPFLDLTFRVVLFLAFAFAAYYFRSNPIEAILDGIFALLFLWSIKLFADGP